MPDSLATQENTQKQIDQLLQSFQNLEKLMIAKIGPSDVTPVQTTPIGRLPPPALPNKFDGNHSRGQAFLTSCQTYICVQTPSPPNKPRSPGLSPT